MPLYAPDLPTSLESARLRLRAPAPGDGAVINAAIRESHERLSRWMPWAREVQSVAETETFVRESMARFRTREELNFLILSKTNETFMGMVGLHHIDWSVPHFEFGYWLRTSAEGNGYMTEAVERLTAFALDTLKAVRLEIRCDARNRPSAAVAERAGYTLEARLKWNARDNDGGLRDTLIYARFGTTNA